jgi:hypothetical protein
VQLESIIAENSDNPLRDLKRKYDKLGEKPKQLCFYAKDALEWSFKYDSV